MKKTLLFIVTSIAFSTVFGQINTKKQAAVYKFDEIMSHINGRYVDTVNNDQLVEAAIVAMLEKLDPHTTYISKEEVDDANSSINGSFVGVGIRFQIMKDTLNVVATIPGGPSEKLGIKPGDKIVMIDGKTIAGVGLKNNQVREKLMGELGSKVTVEIARKGVSKNLVFVITRDKIPIFSVDASYMITPEIGYVKLNSFSRTTLDEVQKSIAQLKLKGMKHLIFDLKGNGGGLLDQAQKIADEFLSDKKLVVYSEGRAQPRSDLETYRDGLWEKGSLVILTDEYTASASEIVSGAIQDWDRGLIVGRRTFGKGLVQRPIDLSDGSQMRLTIARYYTPSGRFIQKPYDDDVDAYRKDLKNRYLNGELQHLDSIKLPDSLKFQTLQTKRTVYGGGGILPDIFVPLDTTEITDYFRSLVQTGLINNFTMDYIEKNRDGLKSTYSSFESFNRDFKVDESFMKTFFAYVAKEDPKLVFNEKEYATSASLIQLRIKAQIAQNAFGINEFYQVFNESDEIIQRAVKAITSKEYSKAKLKN